jgi:hypothetical protein
MSDFETANLFPATTGLPMTIWVRPGGISRDVYIRVNLERGRQNSITNAATVGVQPIPHMLTGRLPARERQAVFAWVSLNTAALVAYWNGEIDTIQFGYKIKRLSPPNPYVRKP